MIGEQLSGDIFLREIERAGLAPYVQIVHGLKYPGPVHADIDHALVCANRVLLVDSKYWQAMHWRWFGDAMIGGAGQNQQVRDSEFTHGVAVVRQMFHPIEVGAAVLLHPSSPGTITVDNSMAGTHPPLVAASEGIAPLLDWLRGALPPTQDEYRRLQSQSMRMVLSITDGFTEPFVASTAAPAITPVVPGVDQPSIVRSTLRSTGSEAANIGRWYLNRRRRKHADFQQKASLADARRQQRHATLMQRRQEQVLRMQHDELNSQRPVRKRKMW